MKSYNCISKDLVERDITIKEKEIKHVWKSQAAA